MYMCLGDLHLAIVGRCLLAKWYFQIWDSGNCFDIYVFVHSYSTYFSPLHCRAFRVGKASGISAIAYSELSARSNAVGIVAWWVDERYHPRSEWEILFLMQWVHALITVSICRDILKSKTWIWMQMKKLFLSDNSIKRLSLLCLVYLLYCTKE